MYYNDPAKKRKCKLKLKHGLVIQVVPFFCSLSVANILQMLQGSSEIERDLTKNHSHLMSKGAYYFKRLLESQNKQSTAFVKKVTFSEKS
jgi:hypothetical protein